jgi:hypothetical protein
MQVSGRDPGFSLRGLGELPILPWLIRRVRWEALALFVLMGDY